MQRAYLQTIVERMNEPRKFIQIVEGPRQVGKSTLIKQFIQQTSIPYLHFAADNVPATRNAWISECWEIARNKLVLEHLNELILIIDEIQRFRQWSEVVKKEWDADTFHDVNIKLILLGSSRVRLEKGLAESLKGRFEIIKMPNWSFAECKEAFGMTLDEYIYYGGYPGAASVMDNIDRWRNYISSSIIDATINTDILIDSPISKPALLRQTFELCSSYSGQMVALTKLLGQLQDAGNTTTLSGYLDLLQQCGMVTGLQKFTMDKARCRASVPKYQVFNNALMSMYQNTDFQTTRQNHKIWGRFVESAVGAHILNMAYVGNFKVFYWRDGNDEVDFVLQHNDRLVAIEVKSNDEVDNKGLHTFTEKYHPYRTLVVGPNAFPVETFLNSNLLELFQ